MSPFTARLSPERVGEFSVPIAVSYLPTNVVTVMLASTAVKETPLTVTSGPDLRLSLADVTQDVSAAGAVPPKMEIGTLAVALPLLMATMTKVLSVPFAL
jgi:hypothetical protein